jgi:hypothetical protein
VREAARRDQGLRFTTLLHHGNERLLLDCFYLLKKEAAPGVDRVTWSEYAQGVEARITDLHDRVHRGAYRAQPSRRAYLRKSDGRQRPLGIAAMEDKIVQQAVATVLHQIEEEDFSGFRMVFAQGVERRGPRWFRGALEALTAGIVTKKVNWIPDADIIRILRQYQPGKADGVGGASDSGSKDTAADQEVAEGRSTGRRAMAGDEAGELRHDLEKRQVYGGAQDGREAMTAKVQSLAANLSQRRNDPIEPTGNWLKPVVRGYYNYYAVPGNLPRLRMFRRATAQYWLYTPAAAQSAQSMDVGAIWNAHGPVSARAESSISLPSGAILRQISKIRAVCVSSARTDLCGGRRVNRHPYRDRPTSKSAQAPRRGATARTSPNLRNQKCPTNSQPKFFKTNTYPLAPEKFTPS